MEGQERSRRRDGDGDVGRKRSRSMSSSRSDDDREDSHRRRGRDKDRSRDHSSRRHKSKKRRDRRHGDGSDSESRSSSSSRSDRGRRHSSKRHRKEKKKRKHRKKKDSKRSSKKKSRRSRSRSPSRSRSRSNSPSGAEAVPIAPPGAHELASALTQLFYSYPAMSSLDEGGIPLLFIQLSRGTEYNLSQMPDRRLALLLGDVFSALKVHGMEMDGNGCWKWGNAQKGVGRGDGVDADLALLRLARALLNGVGFTLERVEEYERDQNEKINNKLREHHEAQVDLETKAAPEKTLQKAGENEDDIRHRKRVERMTSQMLDRFDPKNSSSSESSLANELQGICDVLMEGESVQLDGIENGKLKATLAQLFQLIGLELVEMEEENDEEEEEEDGNVASDSRGEKAMGYALPDRPATRDAVASHLKEVLRVCRFRSSGGSEDAPTSWEANQAAAAGQYEESSSDDDDGPAPLGTVAAAKAARRKRPPQEHNFNTAEAGMIDEGGREEWMMVPGEHDFLKGISKSSTRGRQFKNEKNRGQPIASSEQSAEPINPEILAEVESIQRAYEESRGPSLLDAHRQKVQESKQQAAAKKEWKWSRDKNLEDGRRVDKNALHMVLGGASTELKSKFHRG